MGDERPPEFPKFPEFPALRDNRVRNHDSQHLRDDAYKAMAQAGIDKIFPRSELKPKFDNPYKHIEKATEAIAELESLKSIPFGHSLQIRDAQGRTRELSIEQYRGLLVLSIEREFRSAIDAADRIEQNKVSVSVINLQERIAKEQNPVERRRLESFVFVLDSMKHASSVTRATYANFLTDHGELSRAKDLLDEASEMDVEAKHNPWFVHSLEKLTNELKVRQNTIADDKNPLIALEAASEKRKAGDASGAESEFKRAVELAKTVDPKVVEENLKRLDKLKSEISWNPAATKELDLQKQAWIAMANAGSIAAVSYADFLVEKGRYKEALPLLVSVGHNNPELVKGDKTFQELLQKARNGGKEPEPFDNPFVHLSNIQGLADKEDMQGVRKELEAAIKAADKIDRQKMQDNKRVVLEQLNEEKDPEHRSNLRALHEAYDQFDHSSAFTRICLARFEIANRNYERAQALLAEVESSDPNFSRRPELKFDELKEASQEPSTLSRIWSATTSFLKELACDGVAIAVGAGAALLTGWTGPGAVAVGGAAGATAYTGMKTLVFGEKFSWDMPLWGAVDGITGGTAALARTALARVGGQIVTKEVAANLACKTGVELAKITAKEGTMAYGKAVAQLGREGLKELAKRENLSLWSRMTSRIPLTGAFLGNDQYRAALNAVRGVTARNVATHALVDGGTAFAGSLVYRGAHGLADYHNGKYQDFGDFLSNYGRSVAFDTTKGAGIGAFATSFGYGGLTSFGLNGSREYMFGKNKTVGDWAGRTMLGTTFDLVLGTPSQFLFNGRLSRFVDRHYGHQPSYGFHGSFIAASPQFYQAAEEKQRADMIERTLAELQKPPENDDQLQRNYFVLPGSNEFPRQRRQN
jgi:hypothetical protein